MIPYDDIWHIYIHISTHPFSIVCVQFLEQREQLPVSPCNDEGDKPSRRTTMLWDSSWKGGRKSCRKWISHLHKLAWSCIGVALVTSDYKRPCKEVILLPWHTSMCFYFWTLGCALQWLWANLDTSRQFLDAATSPDTPEEPPRLGQYCRWHIHEFDLLIGSLNHQPGLWVVEKAKGGSVVGWRVQN